MRNPELIILGAYVFVLFGASVEFEEIQAKRENYNNITEITKEKSKSTIISEIPEHWEVKYDWYDEDYYDADEKSTKQDNNVKAFFNTSKTEMLFGRKLALDKIEGRVYVCSNNCIYQLSPNLEIEVENCAEWETKKSHKQWMEKIDACAVLVMDNENGRLIACGGPDGFCNAYSANNISETQHRGAERVVGNEPDNTAAFVGSYFQSNSAVPAPLPALYVGILDDTDQAKDHKMMQLHKVTVRNLQPDSYLTELRSFNPTNQRVNMNTTKFVPFIYGFSYKDCGYFVQNDQNSAASLTKIGHPNDVHSWNRQHLICVDPVSKMTFTSARAAFIHDKREEKDALYVVLIDKSKWAICMYSMNEINRRVTSYSISNKQIRTLNTVEGDFIFSAKSGTPVSFTVTSINSPTIIVFISTIEGYVMKVIIHKHLAHSTLSYHIDLPKPIYYTASNVYCMTLDYSKMHLYILSASTLIKLKVTNCEQYKTKKQCLSLKDPYCGWCITSGQCCFSTECNPGKYSTAWISPDIENYIIISSESPFKAFSSTMQHNITMNLRNDAVPLGNLSITCLFVFNDTIILNTTTTCLENIINCTTPSPHLLPLLSMHEDDTISATLFVMFHSFPILLQSGILAEFFDCSVYDSCTECSYSNNLCYWNVEESRCSHEIHANSDILIIRSKNSDHCPILYPISTGVYSNYLLAEESNNIVQIDHENPAIQFRLRAPKMFASKKFTCSFQLDNHNITVNATISHDTVIDDTFWCIINCKVSLTYDSTALPSIPNLPMLSERKAYFSINYGHGAIETVSDFMATESMGIAPVHINLHKCTEKSDCKSCLFLHHKLKCGWCENITYPHGKCTHKSACAPKNWLESCKNRSFTFTPNTGPWEGGTLVDINRRLYQSKVNKVTVAGAKCQFTDLGYLNLPLILYAARKDQHIHTKCKILRNSSMFHINSGPVVLHFSQEVVKSTSNFQFVDPKIIEFSPRVGPKCGGTEVTINGQYMNAGSQIRVFFDDLECAVLMTEATQLKCIASPSEKSAKYKVKVIFDGNIRTIQNVYFEYDGDIKPDDAISEVPRGTPSGGMNISVSVTDLTSLSQKIMMKVVASNRRKEIYFSSECQVHSLAQIICPSPVMENITGIYSLHENEPVQLDYRIVIETENGERDLSIPLPDPDENELYHVGTPRRKRYPKFLLYPDTIKHILLGMKTPEKGIWLMDNIVLIITASMVVIFVGIVILITDRKKTHKMQCRINKMYTEAIAMSQCIKRVIVEKEIELDENECRVLKLPNVTLAPTSVPRTTDDEPPEMEYELPRDDIWEFPRTNLSLEKSLGQGEFGKVVRGKAIGILEKGIVTKVAIKMLKSTHTDADMICLVLEMEMMKLIAKPGHENVLQLLGCCTQDGPLLIITEYATRGNLLDFLRKHELATTHQLMPGQLNEKTLILFAVQVAKGMEYLASMRCIHRDLAARNILVSDKNVMKIADFGLARDVHGKYYYQQKSNARVPVRWMAPEAIDRGFNTTKSDVWSYGILLYEMVTLGSVPYSSYIEVDKLLRAIKSGHRIEKPQHCSVETYDVMCRCWKYQPEDRPTFTDIVVRLEEMLEKDKDSEPEEITPK